MPKPHDIRSEENASRKAKSSNDSQLSSRFNGVTHVLILVCSGDNAKFHLGIFGFKARSFRGGEV